MSSQQGASRTQPNLQPKPIAISPMAHQVQNVVGRPLLSPLPAQQAGQQFMVGTVRGAVPLNVSQPRMAAQVLQQNTRMAMYVPTQTPPSPISQTVPKIVTGLPIYQNPIRIHPNTVTPSGAIVRAITSTGLMQPSSKPSPINIVPQNQSIIQAPVNQLHLQTSPLPAAHLVSTTTGLAIQGANQIRAQSVGLQGAVQLKELRPGSSLQKASNTNKTFQMTSAIGIGSPALPNTTQVIAPVTQIPTPKFFTSPASSTFYGQQTSHSPLSPLVPISPRMFQFARPIGAQTQVFSPTSIATMQPAVLGLSNQPYAIYSQGKPGLNSQALLVNNMPVSISSPLMGTLPVSIDGPSEACKDDMDSNKPEADKANKDNLDSDKTPELAVDKENPIPDVPGAEKPSPDIPTLSVTDTDEDTLKDRINDNNLRDVARETLPNEDNRETPKDHESSRQNSENSSENKAQNFPDKLVDRSTKSPKNVENEDIDKNWGIVNKNEIKIENRVESQVDEESRVSDMNMMESFHKMFDLKPNTDPERFKRLEEKVTNEADQFSLERAGIKGISVFDGVENEIIPADPYVPDMEEEEEFIWEEYLQDIGAKAVPPTAFRHVDFSLTTGFVKDMKLEVPNKSDPDTYWVATVLNTCGPLLRLRYDGYDEDSTRDFWCDLATDEIHSIGWCAQNGKNLQPPEQIKNKHEDWKEFLMRSLTGARTAPSFLLDKTGMTPIDQLKCGMRLEIQDSLNPLEVWLVQILENVGGRLFLRLEGTYSASKHFWMFYLNIRLHPIGWAKENECTYKPPKDIEGEHSASEWEEILETALKESDGCTPPSDIFKDQAVLKEHKFEVGMKLEALNPAVNNMVSPATVRRVINNKYFMIEMDDLRPKEQRESVLVCCNTEYLGIFPITWCQCKGIRLVPPPGWNRPDFLWSEYLSFCNSKAAPEKLFLSGTEDHEFERAMKLEAVNPAHPNQICAATITKIVGPLLWIHLDNTKDVPSHIEDIDSHNLFPIGWCASNGVELKPPRKSRNAKGKIRCHPFVSDNLNGEAYRCQTYRHVRMGTNGGSWCPKLFINHRCFSGPYLSKGRIADLPKSVGPGPMGLVLKEVISLLAGVAYKSCRVLKELQLEGPPNPRMQRQLLKSKYKGKSYQAIVEVCRYDHQLEEFCRNICIKLECCPYLFSVLHVTDNCPENCQQLTKTKYNYNYGKKKKKPGRPPLSSNTEKGPKIGMKRGRKKKRFHLIQKKSHTQGAYIPKLYQKKSGQIFMNGDGKDEGFVDDERSWVDSQDLTPSKKRKYTHHIPPPSDIQTRGAKLPKYSFERKTHKKILLSASSPPMKSKASIKQNPMPSKPEPLYNGRILMPREESLRLDSNPLFWSVDRVVSFIKSTDCSHLARIIKEQEIDGQALLLLSLPVIQEHLDLKLGPAVKLCHLIERLKVSFYENYA